MDPECPHGIAAAAEAAGGEDSAPAAVVPPPEAEADTAADPKPELSRRCRRCTGEPCELPAERALKLAQRYGEFDMDLLSVSSGLGSLARARSHRSFFASHECCGFTAAAAAAEADLAEAEAAKASEAAAAAEAGLSHRMTILCLVFVELPGRAFSCFGCGGKGKRSDCGGGSGSTSERGRSRGILREQWCIWWHEFARCHPDCGGAGTGAPTTILLRFHVCLRFVHVQMCEPGAHRSATAA